MQRGINLFVISRENNVVRVDFSRDPDPPAPRFPGASGLREIGNGSALPLETGIRRGGQSGS